MEVKVIEILH